MWVDEDGGFIAAGRDFVSIPIVDGGEIVSYDGAQWKVAKIDNGVPMGVRRTEDGIVVVTENGAILRGDLDSPFSVEVKACGGDFNGLSSRGDDLYALGDCGVVVRREKTPTVELLEPIVHAPPGSTLREREDRLAESLRGYLDGRVDGKNVGLTLSITSHVTGPKLQVFLRGDGLAEKSYREAHVYSTEEERRPLDGWLKTYQASPTSTREIFRTLVELEAWRDGGESAAVEKDEWFSILTTKVGCQSTEVIDYSAAPESRFRKLADLLFDEIAIPENLR